MSLPSTSRPAISPSPRHSLDSNATSVQESRFGSGASVTTSHVLPISSNIQLGVSRKGKFNAISTLIAPPTASSSLLSQSLSLLPTPASLGLPTLPTLPNSLPPPSLPSGQKSTLTPSAKRSAPPAIVLRNLGNVPKSKDEFDFYLKSIQDGGLYQKWERMGGGKGKEKQREQIPDREEEEREESSMYSRSNSAMSVNSRRPSMMDINLPTSPPVLTVDRFLGFGNHKSPTSSSRPMRKEDLPSLDIVPPIYFSADFDLSNPTVWDAVTERPSADTGFPFGLQSSSAITVTPPNINETNPSPLSMIKTNTLTLADLASDQILQEKLSHYLTLLESHLSVEISIRSTSFFSALSSLKSLSSVSSYALDSLYLLREELQNLDNDVASKGLAVLEVRKERRRLERVEKGLQDIGLVVDSLRDVEGMVERGEWETALQAIDSLGVAMEPPKDGSSNMGDKLDLSRITALSYVPGRLEEFRNVIGKQLEGEALNLLEMDFASYRKDWKRRKLEKEKEGKGTIIKNSKTVEALTPIVSCLLRAGGVEGVIAGWKQHVSKEMKTVVRERLPLDNVVQGFSAGAEEEIEGLSNDQVSESVGVLRQNLREMPQDQFLTLITKSSQDVLEFIEILDEQTKCLLSLITEEREKIEQKEKEKRTNGLHGKQNGGTILEEDEDIDASPELMITRDSHDGPRPLEQLPSPPHSPVHMPYDESSSLPLDLAEIVYIAADLANARLSKIISVRGEVHSKLTLSEFVKIFRISWNFVIACEVISRRMIVSLRAEMVSQAKGFLSGFHNRMISEMSRQVEEERWEPADVEGDTQEIMDLILSSAVKDPKEFMLEDNSKANADAESTSMSKSASWKDSIKPNGSFKLPFSKTSATNGELPEKPKRSKTLIDIEDRSFFAVRASLKCVEAVAEYLKLVLNLELLTIDAIAKIVEFLKAFNSRTCQVVLGAGAMRSAGLKNITARHLALASQSLSIMTSLIPYARETLRRHLNVKQAVMLVEFDRLKRDYQDHQNEIHSKLVAIMQDRLTVHCSSLRAIDWDANPEPNDGKANPYMETLVKEVATLHKVLYKFLHSSTVENIMTQVFNAIDESVKAEMLKIDIKNESIRGKMVKDIRYMRSKLGELKGLELSAPGEEIEKTISLKAVVTPEPPTPTRRSTLANLGSYGYAIRLPSSRFKDGAKEAPLSPRLWSSSSATPPSPSATNSPRPSMDVPNTPIVPSSLANEVNPYSPQLANGSLQPSSNNSTATVSTETSSPIVTPQAPEGTTVTLPEAPVPEVVPPTIVTTEPEQTPGVDTHDMAVRPSGGVPT